MADSELRQRKPVPQEEEPEVEEEELFEKPKPSKVSNAVDNDYSGWLDALRVASFLLFVFCISSYVISNGESWFWGMKNKPNYVKPSYWREKIRGPPPPIYLTLEELSAYDGTDEEKPLYLAINGTIFDVSKGRRMYGPGGPYHYFAGVDAARGFVTGCFAEDRTADMRGVEEMYLPLDDPEIDSYWSAAELKEIKEEELRDAKKHVHQALLHWVKFFARSEKYSRVGFLKREPDWLEKEPLKPLCAAAQNGRAKRAPPTQSADDETN